MEGLVAVETTEREPSSRVTVSSRTTTALYTTQPLNRGPGVHVQDTRPL